MSEYATPEVCGCCEGDAPAPALYNRPGLSSLAYRIRTYGDALEAMRSTLARPYLNVLTGRLDPEGRREAERITLGQGLTTRAEDDPSQALLDAWAVAVDVLTFYQERIANEGFLRTATERRSVLELARAIGYELSPAVAASTHLAFTVETAPGAPAQALVDAGTRVMSIPGQDELPQTFETSDAITARAAWNSLRPRLSVPFLPLERGMDTLCFRGIDVRLEPGDAILLVGDERLNDPAPKDDNHWDFRILESVTRVRQPDPARSYTVVKVRPLGEAPPRLMNPSTQGTRAYVFRARAALFGHNAPDWRPLSHTTRKAYKTGYDEDVPATWGSEWPDFFIKNVRADLKPSPIDLDRTYPKVLPGSWLVLQKEHYVELYRVLSTTRASRNDYLLTGQVTRAELDTGLGLNSFPLRETTVHIEPEEIFFAERPLAEPLYGHDIVIDGAYPELARGQPLALSGRRQRLAVLVTGLALTLDAPDQTGAATRPLAPGDTLQILAPPTIPQSPAATQLTPAELVHRLTQTTATIGWQLLDRDGTTGALVATGQQVALAPALEDDPVLSEVAIIADTEAALRVERDDTFVQVRDPLAACYDPATVTINANTVHATHGTTVANEVLGSGDAGRPNQRFWLKKPPLTYVSAATASGALSTLSLRVNQVQWDEAPSLYGLTPRDQVYTIRIQDDGKTAVVFGDGRQGARPPSGFENIVATYRTGSGPEGEVDASQLSLLLTRPLGIRSVSNPAPARGAAPAEKMEDARRNAPNTVLTLDRIVSLRDFEDFARGFAGIGKARAARLWTGQDFLVHITAATASGDPLAPGDVYDNLVAAIDAARDPQEPLVVSGYVPVTFSFEADVLIDAPRFLAENVLADIRALLDETFSFDRRDFGQPVTLAEVVTAIQQVAGVIAVDMVSLARDSSSQLGAASLGQAASALEQAQASTGTPGLSAGKRKRQEASEARGGVSRSTGGANVRVKASRVLAAANRRGVLRQGRTEILGRGVRTGSASRTGGSPGLLPVRDKARLVRQRQITPTPFKRTQISGRAGGEPPALLTARAATYDISSRQIVLAELLLLNPDGIVLREMSA